MKPQKDGLIKMSIETYGTGERLRIAAGLSVPFGIERRIVLLPVPTTRDGVTVTSTDIPISDAVSEPDDNTYVFGYGLPGWMVNSLCECGAHVTDLSQDEEYLLENAELTAIGALGYIITTSKAAPGDLSFGIVGYGRIGSCLTRLLLFFGARVRVFTSRESVRRELGAHDVSTSDASLPLDTSGIDVLINTAPKDMSEGFIYGIPLGMRVIELASGKNFPGVEGVEYLPALPERYFPMSAGRAYAAAVKRAITEGEI